MRAFRGVFDVALFASILLHQSTYTLAFIHDRAGRSFPTLMKNKNCHVERKRSCSSSSTSLGAGDIFDSFRQLWGGQDDNNRNGDDEKDLSNVVDDDIPAGTTVLASIPGTNFDVNLFPLFYPCIRFLERPTNKPFTQNLSFHQQYFLLQ